MGTRWNYSNSMRSLENVNGLYAHAHWPSTGPRPSRPGLSCNLIFFPSLRFALSFSSLRRQCRTVVHARRTPPACLRPLSSLMSLRSTQPRHPAPPPRLGWRQHPTVVHPLPKAQPELCLPDAFYGRPPFGSILFPPAASSTSNSTTADPCSS
jgi:hypothetical protein